MKVGLLRTFESGVRDSHYVSAGSKFMVCRVEIQYGLSTCDGQKVVGGRSRMPPVLRLEEVEGCW